MKTPKEQMRENIDCISRFALGARAAGMSPEGVSLMVSTMSLVSAIEFTNPSDAVSDLIEKLLEHHADAEMDYITKHEPRLDRKRMAVALSDSGKAFDDDLPWR